MLSNPTRQAFAAHAAVLLGLLGGCAQVPDGAATRHMIAAANPHAARAGLEILRAGGSALDAAIAAQMVLTLVEPQSSGIGGGAFLLHYAPPGDRNGGKPALHAYDGRERAPAGVTERHYLKPDGTPMDRSARSVGGHSVAVPGLLRMAELAHRAHGKLPWARLFAPAIRLASHGFAVSPRLNLLIARNRRLAAFPVARRFFFTQGGKPLAVGATLRNPALADTLRQVAAGGADAFYRGAIAADIAAAVRTAVRYPGALTQADLEAYRARARPVLCRRYRAWRVCTMPPPTTGGIATLQILGLLERFDLHHDGAGWGWGWGAYDDDGTGNSHEDSRGGERRRAPLVPPRPRAPKLLAERRRIRPPIGRREGQRAAQHPGHSNRNTCPRRTVRIGARLPLTTRQRFV